MDPLTAIVDLGSTLIQKIWPDPAKQQEELRKLQELQQAGDLAELNAHVQLLVGQMEINKIEAASPHWFVAGWRPFVGWVCGSALAYAAIIEPLMRFIAKIFGYSGTFPVIDTEITMQVLLGMLGLGVMRSRDKEKQVDTKSISKWK
jgi:hypothetical protein